MKNKINIYQRINLFLIPIIAILLYISPFFVTSEHWIKQSTLQNVFMEYCIASAAFGKHPLIFLSFYLIISIAFVLATIFIIIGKYSFCKIIFIILSIDIVFHFLFFYNNAFSYCGLIFKLVILFILFKAGKQNTGENTRNTGDGSMP